MHKNGYFAIHRLKLVEPCKREASCRRKTCDAAVRVILSQQHSAHTAVFRRVTVKYRSVNRVTDKLKPRRYSYKTLSGHTFGIKAVKAYIICLRCACLFGT